MVIQDWRNIGGDRGNSGFDRRHRLVAYALVDLPFGGGRRWLASGGPLGALFGDWRLSGIVSMQSGGWFDVTLVDPANRLGVTPGSSAWRPDLVGNPRMPHPTPQLDQPGGVRRAAERRRNVQVRRSPAEFPAGPRVFQCRCGSHRELRLGGARRLQIRWEVFNVTNHPSYGLPNATWAAPSSARLDPR